MYIHIYILVFIRFFDICRNLGNAKEKPMRKICFSCEMKRLVSRIYFAQFCQAAFLWCQRSFYCNFMRKRCWNGAEVSLFFAWLKEVLEKMNCSFFLEPNLSLSTRKLWLENSYLGYINFKVKFTFCEKS